MVFWHGKRAADLTTAIQRLSDLVDQVLVKTEVLAENSTRIHRLQDRIVKELVESNRALFIISLSEEYKALMPDRVLHFLYEGHEIHMLLPTGPSDVIQRDILNYKSFFHVESLQMIKDNVPMNGERVLDVGAYIGNHTVYFSAVCGAAEVLSFEPILNSFVALQRNVELNRVGGRQFNLGLGASKTSATARINPINGGGNSLDTLEPGSIEIVPLDSLDLPTFVLLKIDVEGMAREVLLGARETIAKAKPVIVVEAFPHEFDAVHEVMTSLNYRKKTTVAEDHLYFPTT